MQIRENSRGEMFLIHRREDPENEFLDGIYVVEQLSDRWSNYFYTLHETALAKMRVVM
ncbi:hypothetical protein NVP1262O_34 [Vibrio phage 1.262.O._10N.286.51.A9]|nr:hypothetical protein NVP1262O_34 [Vibrio phage 1.262.O._10N.286.51.A9]